MLSIVMNAPKITKIAHNIASKSAHQTVLLNSSNYLKNQAQHITTTFLHCGERDNGNNNAHEGHNASKIYQSSCSRLVFSALNAAVTATDCDRLVYQHFKRTVLLENCFANQKQLFTRHNQRFYCTKSTKRKMVSYSIFFNFQFEPK